MAKNVVINGASYNAVPAAAANILSGYTAYGASGKITGEATAANISQDSTTKVLTIS